MRFTLIGSTGDPLQHADDFGAIDWDCLIGTIRWELWAGEQCLAQVDLGGQHCTEFVIQRVRTAAGAALHCLEMYKGRVVIRIGECFRPVRPPHLMYVVQGQPHDPSERCGVCWAKGWGPATRCPCCGAEDLAHDEWGL